MSLIDIVGSKTLAYKDTFKKTKVPAQVCFWGTGEKKADCQEHVSQLSDCLKK